MITLNLEYTGSQIIASSNRVTLHSKEDGVFLYGKGTVGISSPNTVNVDSREAVLIYSPIIYLGSNATEKAVKGDSMMLHLGKILEKLETLCSALEQLSETNYASVVPVITTEASSLKTEIVNRKNALMNSLSNVVYVT